MKLSQIISVLFWSSRPVSWVNTAFPFAAAYFVMSGSFDARLIVGAVYFLIPYNLLMYGINDVFDYESDMKNPRKGGIEGAKFSRKTHRPILIASATLNLPFLIALFWLGNLISGVVLAAVIFFVLAYSLPKLRFKERAFLDSITSSLHFVGPAIYAFSLTEFNQPAIIILIGFFLWGIASHAFGAVQDLNSDKAAGIGSIATKIDAKWTTRFAAILYVFSAILVATLGWLAAIISVFVLLYAVNILPYLNLNNKNAERANQAWRKFIYLNLGTGAVITVILIYFYMV